MAGQSFSVLLFWMVFLSLDMTHFLHHVGVMRQCRGQASLFEIYSIYVLIITVRINLETLNAT